MNKKFAAAFLLLNALLAVTVLWLLHRALTAQTKIAAPRIVETNPSAQTETAPSPTPVSASPHFRWSQLESTNYLTYIANLRNIGCPEQTLRDIITADVDSAFYAARRQQLKQQQPTRSLDDALQELNGEEAAFIEELLTGHMASKPQIATATPARAPKLAVKSFSEREAERPSTVPLVMQPLDSDSVQLTEVQKQTINDLRQKFLDEIGGTNQDPNDPAYRQRWQAAQREADDLLAGELGRNFVLKYQSHSQSQAAPSH